MKNRILPVLATPLLLTSCLSSFHYEFNNDVSYEQYNERSLLDIAFPKNKKETSLIVYIHGGAWIGGSKDGFVKRFTKQYDDGYAYAAINYRYASEIYHCNDILDDIQSAMLKIKDISDSKNIHINKAAFFGHSAGGHLSLLYAYKNRDICPFDVGFVSSLSGPTDLTDNNYLTNTILKDNYCTLASYMTGIAINESNFNSYKNELLEVSPISYMDKACPTIICHGDKDSVVPYSNALSLKDKLEENNKTYDFFIYTGSDHDLGNSKDVEKLYQQKFKEYKEKYL
ncbi:MAG: alpha/beta hydrolase [Bacilli bacterium]|nr:alpha/beta hydrolase [Bacilli bacterium]